MDTFIKRIQSRLIKKDLKVSKEEIRDVYETIVEDLENPTEEEINYVIGEFLNTNQKQLNPAYTTQQTNQQQQEDNSEMPNNEANQNALVSVNSEESNGNKITHSQQNIILGGKEIQEAVEQHFGCESDKDKEIILKYVSKNTYSTATELKERLHQLRQVRLSILLKTISDYNNQLSSDQEILKNAVAKATAKRERESEAFFDSFEKQLTEMKAEFGL